ncbi:MAG TPA: hypothetical protein VGS21_02745 [Acidimicrobiales bacterium]|nr:hypothetical protein [Acidimicrobiales bacterium]
MVGAFVLPFYRGQVSDGTSITNTAATLVQENGIKVLLPLSLPLVASALAAIGIWRHATTRRRAWMVAAWVAAGSATLTALAGILTVGIFLLPVSALLLIGCASAD